MPPLRRKIAAGRFSCPDPETLCAVIEEQSSDALRAAIADHLLGCSACADLHARLLNFQQGSVLIREAEWNQTEKRLDNWLNSSLGSGVLEGRLPKRAEASGLLPWRKRIAKSPFAWRLQGALGAAAMVVLGVIGAFVTDRRLTVSPIQVAVRATPPGQESANTAPVPTPAQTGGSETQVAKLVKPAGRGSSSVANVRSSETASIRPPSVGHSTVTARNSMAAATALYGRPTGGAHATTARGTHAATAGGRVANGQKVVATRNGAAKPPAVALGQTPGQVIAALGQPKSVMDLGAKKIYVYKDSKVIFRAGKVADIQ